MYEWEPLEFLWTFFVWGPCMKSAESPEERMWEHGRRSAAQFSASKWVWWWRFLHKKEKKTNISGWKRGTIHTEDTKEDAMWALGDERRYRCAVNKNTWSPQQNWHITPCLCLWMCLSGESPAMSCKCEMQLPQRVPTQFSGLPLEVMSENGFVESCQEGLVLTV